MATKTRVKDESTLHTYRIEIPVLIDDMGLSVYARSLYIHLKRRAGEKGSCYESARALAQACGMSAGQVSKAKDELESRGLIVRGVKMVRGGVGDDISIVDVWPETFKRYAPESEQTKESDHHTITSPSKRSPHDHLEESDHHTITSDQSDQEVIALTSKRSPHDPKNHDLPYKKDLDPPPPPPPNPPSTNGGGGGGDSLTQEEPTPTEQYLLDEEFSDAAAYEFRLLDLEACKRDIRKARAGGQQNGGIIRRWRRSPPRPVVTSIADYARPAPSLPADALTPEAARAHIIEGLRKK